MRRSLSLPGAAALLLLTARPPDRLAAQTGFATSAAAAESSFEARLVGVPDTASARAMTRALSARPHMAGTAAQAETRDYVLAKLRSWDLEKIGRAHV